MLVVIIGIAEWPQYARTIRASVLAEKKKEYVEAARVMGFKAPRIMFPPHSTELSVSNSGYLYGTGGKCHHVRSGTFFPRPWPSGRPTITWCIDPASAFNYIFSGAWWITAFPGVWYW